MPSQKPRLAITLSPESRDALARLSKVAGISASGFVASMVHDSIPVIIATAEALEQARKSPVKAAQVMNEAAVRGVAELVQAKLQLEAAVKRPRVRRKRAE